MKRFEGVRLRDGIGWVSRDGVVAPRSGEDDLSFHVVDASSPVAVLSRGKTLVADVEVRVVAALHDAGFALVVVLGPQADGAAVGRAHGDAAGSIEDAACAAWALKALGGWDESPLMTFRLANHEETTFVSVRATFASRSWTVEVTPQRRGGWKTLLDDVARLDVPRGHAVILTDVDQMLAYNDAHGHDRGDLALARVHACVEHAALEANARFLRVGGDDLALLVDGEPAAAATLAETIRAAVEALDIPFTHPTVPTHGRLTISAGVVRADAPVLRETLEETLWAAKRAGRNRVAVHGEPHTP